MKPIQVPTGKTNFLIIHRPTRYKQYVASLLFDDKTLAPFIKEMRKEYPDYEHKYLNKVDGMNQIHATSLMQPKLTVGGKEYKLIPNLQAGTVCSITVVPKLRGMSDILFDLVAVDVTEPVLYVPRQETEEISPF